MAHPSKFTQPLANEIVKRLSDGEPLEVILRSDKKFPSSTTFRAWAAARPELASAIAQARLEGFDAIARTARETARGRGDSTKDIQRDKLIVETDLKLLAKWDPKRYGDRINVDGIEPSTINLTVNASTLPAMQAGYKQLREAIANGRN